LFSQKKLTIIEDAAQSFGARWNDRPSGSLGDISCLSFDPTKNLNNYGSGGMVLTDDHNQYINLQSLRDNGKRTDHVISGTNSKMSEVDCAHMLVKLKYFDEWQKRRQQIAEYYSEQLQDYVLTPEVDCLVEHAWSKYVCHHNERTMIMSMLAAEGIESKIHYSKPMHYEGVGLMASIQNDNFLLEGSEEFSKTTFSLPMYPELTDSEVESIVETVKYCTSY
jgi:dTDP-4-amino-4,6-dideoxygalactose transaminase